MTFQTFTPIEYLMIDVANNFGHDKLDWDKRISWFKENEHQLDLLQETAAEPALYFAGVQAYHKAKAGQAIAYPISLDATASGAQILAALIGCRKSAELCNVVDAGKRMDLYTAIYEIMQGSLAEQEGDDAEIIQGAGITRKDVKQAVMTSLYGSTAMPKKVFGADSPLLEMFYQTMIERASGVWKLNEAILGLWQPAALSHDWTMPDNFHVHVKVIDDQYDRVSFLDQTYVIHSKVNRPMDSGLSIGANLVHSIDGMIVREISRRCSFDQNHMIKLIEMIMQSDYERPFSTHRPKDKLVKTLWDHYEASGFLSARIIENLDEHNMAMVDYSVIMKLIKSMPQKSFSVLSIHDCFRVHPNYANDLRRQYNQLLHEIASSELLSYLACQIANDSVTAPKFDNIANDILQSNYALS